jgi:hypothetical protein
MPKKREPPKPLAKALTLFIQLLGFFSSSITLKSYAVHSAIRVFNSILYDLPNIDSCFYLAKVLIFIESKAFVYRFARDLSNFGQKQGWVITKKMILHKLSVF